MRNGKVRVIKGVAASWLIGMVAVSIVAGSTPALAATEVVVQSGDFSQDPVTINAREEVMWITPHEYLGHLWFIDHWRTPMRPPTVAYELGGKHVRVKFHSPGTYRYLCRMNHAVRRGTVIVK